MLLLEPILAIHLQFLLLYLSNSNEAIMTWRKRFVRLHRIVGLLGGLLLAVMGLTGSMIVFHQEIDHALNPHLMQVTAQDKRVPIESVLASAQNLLPGSRLESLQMPQQPEETYRLSFHSAQEIRHDVFVNPYTGEILGQRRVDRTIIGFLYALHHDLGAGKFGLYLVGVSGVIMIIQSLTGLVLWTGWRKLKSGFKLRWGAPMQLLSFDLHNAGGFIFNLLLLLAGFTGLIIAGAHILLAPPALTSLPPAFQPTIAMRQLLKQADIEMPEGKTMSLAFPDEQLLVISKKLPSDHPRFYFSSVTLNATTGETVEVSKIVKKPVMWQFLVPIADLHFGTVGGLATRLLYALLGIVPTVLFTTGLILWANSKKRSKSAQLLEVSSD
jgi:uncharacterized iron-regulated membrane protein